MKKKGKIIVIFFIVLFCTNFINAQISLTFSTQANTICNGNGCAYTGPSILINEVMLTPASKDGSIYGTGPGWNPGDNEGEWIELYNPDKCKPVDISCYFLGNNTNETYLGQVNIEAGFSIPPGTIVPPRGFAIIRGINALSVPANLLVQNGGNTVEIITNDSSRICLGGGSRLWFPNLGGWFAFYDNNGIPQDAISWNDTTYSYLFENPCNPLASGCLYTDTLLSYNNITAAYKTYISSINPANTPGQSFRRIPDGGSWAFNTPDVPTYGYCNDTCIAPAVITCNGTATVYPSGGTPPYSYIWDDSQTQLTATATGLCAGTYCVTVSDISGQTNYTCITVQNYVPTVTLAALPDICNDSLPILLTSGQPAGGIYLGTGISNDTLYPSIPGVGTYNIIYTYTDSAECFNSDTTQFNILHVVANAGTDQIICYGQNANLTAFGGGTYQWSNGSNNQSTNVTPLSTTVYIVTVTIGGCTATDDVMVTVNNLPPANAGIDQAICYGDSLNLNASGGVEYLWEPALNISDSTIANPVAYPLSTTTYIVTVTDTNGCYATDEMLLTVYPQIFPSAGNDTSICKAQQTVTLNASGGASYIWSPSTGLNNVNVANPVANPAVSTIYTVTVSDAHGCTATDDVTITVHSVPTYTFTTDSVTCYSVNDGAINIVTNDGSLPYTFIWAPNVSSGDTAQNLTAGNYMITISDINGCDTTVNATVGGPPQILMNTSGNVTICNGQNTTINASATGGTGSYSFVWDNGLGSGISFNVNPTSTTTYIVSVTDANGCTTFPDTVTVTVLPPISVNVLANPASLCYGNSTVLTATANGGNGNYIYTWDQGIGQSTPSITLMPSDTTVYTVTVTDDCGSPQGVDSVEVIVFPIPTVQFTSNPLSGCNPLDVGFTDMSTPAIGSWLWNFGDIQSGVNNTSTLQNPTHLYNYPGNYIITLNVITTNGCGGSGAFQSTIQVFPTPIAAFDMYPHSASTQNSTITFTDLSTNAATWNWNFGEYSNPDNTSSVQNPQHIYENAGNYTVILIVESTYGCADTATNDILIKQDFIIFFPNAFTPNGDGDNEGFRAEGSGIDLNNYQMFIYDRWGELIFKTNDFYEYWDGKIMGSDKLAEVAVYTWVVFVKDVNGNSYKYNGKVTLVR